MVQEKVVPLTALGLVIVTLVALPEQIDWPGFERFRQKGMVGVGESPDRDTPRFVPRQAVKVDKDAHEFRNCDARMRVIELDRALQGQGGQVSIGPQVALHQVQQRG